MDNTKNTKPELVKYEVLAKVLRLGTNEKSKKGEAKITAKKGDTIELNPKGASHLVTAGKIRIKK